MSQGFFKRNEKLFMLLLLVILAPTFAFTGIMSAVLGDPAGSAESNLQMNGRSFSVRELGEVRDQLNVYMAANQFRSIPGYAPKLTLQVLEEQIALEAEAAERNIVVSDTEFQERIRDLGIQLIAWDKAMKDAPPGSNMFQMYQAVQQSKASTPFLVKDYTAAVKSLMRVPIRDFEQSVRRGFLGEKMREIATNGVVVSEKDIWNKYDEQMHKRTFSAVRLPVDNFTAKGEQAVVEALAKGDAGRAEFIAFYNSNIDDFELPDRLKVSALRLDSINFNLSYQPTDEEIQARYDRDKESLYLTTEEFDPFAEEEPSEYLPLAAVRAQVVQSLRSDYVSESGVKLLEEVIAAAKATPEKDASLLDFVPEEKRAFFEIIDSELFARDEIAGLPSKISNTANLTSLFNSFDLVTVGQVCDEPVPMTDAFFVYQVTEVEPAKAPLFQDNEPAARKAWVKAKAEEAVIEHLEGWATQINAEGSTATLTSLAAAENYTVLSFQDLTRSDTSKMRADGKPIASASVILQNAFTIAEEKQAGTPALNSDKTEGFLCVFEGRSEADPSQFANRRQSYENQALQQKRNDARTAYIEALLEKHKVARVAPPTSDDDAEIPSE